MHASWTARLTVTFAEVQKALAKSINRLKKRTQRRVAWPERPTRKDISDPVFAMLAAAPIDDEPVTDDDRRHIAEGWQAYREGLAVSEEEAEQACLETNDAANHRQEDRTAPT